MRAGGLNKKVSFIAKDSTQNSFGEDVLEEVLYKETFAQISHIGNSSKLFSKTYASTDVKKLSIRYIAGITTSMFVKTDGELYEILEIVNPYMKNKALIILISKVD